VNDMSRIQFENNNDIAKYIPEKPIRLMDQFRFFIRAKNYALKTEKPIVIGWLLLSVFINWSIPKT